MVTNTNFDENENPTFIDGCNIEGKQGVYVKGKDVIHLDAPEICFSVFSEDDPLIMTSSVTEVTVTDTELKMKTCGDGLYYFGGDLFCAYKLLGTTVNEDSVVFEYGKYSITVEWENDGNGKRINPKWKREYKQVKNESEVQ